MVILFVLCFLGAAVVAAGDTINITLSSGITSTVPGAQTVSFNNGLPSGFTKHCTTSSDCGIFPSSTDTNDANDPTGNTNDFIASGTGQESISIKLATVQKSLGITTPINYFGLYWGSVDSYNTLDFYDGSTLVDSFTGQDLLDMDPSLIAGTSSIFVNFFMDGTPVTKITLTSSSENFESVNEAFAETDVPEPASLALFGLGLIGLALLLRRRLAS